MNVLQVSLKPPHPKVDGGSLAIAAITDSLLAGKHQVKVLTIGTRKHPFEEEKVPVHILNQTKMEAIEVDTQIKPTDALLNLFSSESYNIARFYSSRFNQRLVELLEAEPYDIVHVESIFCTPYLSTIRSNSSAKVVVRAHNVEFKIWEQLAIQEKNPMKKWYLNLLSARLKKYEIEVLKNVDGITAITEDDAKTFQELGIKVPLEVIPVAVDVSKVEKKPLRSDELHLYHLGAMDWLPNVEGVKWFLDDIWSLLSTEIPEVMCSLAGRKMPSELIKQSSKNLTIEGEVLSVPDFISDKNVAVIPLISGSGLRVKIVEALAYGKVVISTTIGATGIPYTNGKNILIADTPQEFVKQIRMLKENPERIDSIGKEGRKLAEREFDLSVISSKLTYFYANL